ncbi:hypothetical protein Patl1_34021 [Pistacia atlantica]|uniref:Uncharacterized protein n=1 Tax=Pistacia atlantica TaxID=434234 RepID=A0ACC0ZSU5_9ROSI|nr:hypothetical protein Patl1_34021 [Pistacia atlantica]
MSDTERKLENLTKIFKDWNSSMHGFQVQWGVTFVIVLQRQGLWSSLKNNLVISKYPLPQAQMQLNDIFHQFEVPEGKVQHGVHVIRDEAHQNNDNAGGCEKCNVVAYCKDPLFCQLLISLSMVPPGGTQPGGQEATRFNDRLVSRPGDFADMLELDVGTTPGLLAKLEVEGQFIPLPISNHLVFSSIFVTPGTERKLENLTKIFKDWNSDMHGCQVQWGVTFSIVL